MNDADTLRTRCRKPRAVASSALAALTVLALSGCPSGGGNSETSPPVPDEQETDNSAPTLAGEPPSSTKVGESYSFTPDATDPDGDTLQFAVENGPDWASFDKATGALSGEPQTADAGEYPDITITVSDGEATDSMTFSIAVNQIATGSVTLSWEAPTMNDDGTVLTDLTGFKVYYGKQSGDYTDEILIDNPSLTSYVVENLTPATYYFVATAINSEDEESNHSGVAEFTVDDD